MDAADHQTDRPDPSRHRRTPEARASRRRRAGLVLCVMLGILFGLGAFTFDYAEGTSYLSNDPKACVNCHIMREQHDAWQKAGHHAVATCNDCHVPHDFFGKYYTKMEHGYRHSKGFTFQDFHEPIQIKDSSLRIVDQNCIRCHAEFVSHLTDVGSVQGEISCVHCHQTAGHGPQR